jgi:N-acetylmuramoyl-L-alanine amidase
MLPFMVFAQNDKYLEVEVETGDGVYSLLKRYKLSTSSCNIDYFKQINQLKEDLTLKKHINYKLPVKIYKYNGSSIRSTIGVNDWDLAVRIQSYNEEMHKSGFRSRDYRDDLVLWVPYELTDCDIEYTSSANSTSNTKTFPIFGKEYEEVEIIDDQLSGSVYYIVAGHGGPDPGAINNYEGHTLCEDEYAYDISLRLARNLLQHSATVYMITRDDNDGIRSEPYLKPDKDEVCYPNQEIPLNQIKRLNQRVVAINSLFNKHKKQGAVKQRAIIIHVDSRSSTQRIDMYFYHNPKSKSGKELASILRNTIEEKYHVHQRGRGYSGTVKARNLHMLRETYPVAVYAELGNIRNDADLKRFIIEYNRQAVANWLTEGLLKE